MHTESADNIPAELLKHGRPEMIKVLHYARGSGKQRHGPKRLISHPSKVLLQVILNKLKGKAEEILAEEQAGSRAGRSTIVQIFNVRLII